MENKIDIFKSTDGIEVQVKLEQDTVWLDAHLIAKLFGVQRPAIVKHVGNIYKSKELKENSTCSKMEQVASDGKLRKMKLYNLDMIISVGYRVNSSRATQFRIWANSILKDYLVKGYAVNQKRLEQKEQEVRVLKNGIQILSRAIEDKTEDNQWLKIFAKGLSLLDDYDHEELDAKGISTKEAEYPTLEEYQQIIKQMLTEFDSDVFGKEKDQSFQSSVAQIAKGFGTDDFYTTLEEKAAMLLYLVVKNHSFVDGNKRIAAACFLKFLQHNNMLFNKQKQPIISNDTLASLTLLIASSKPEEMETVKRLVISVLNRNRGK
ncbi:virulence protein RhuM/Fic/DOC family protein [Flavicella sediminum]|uniref:virulence protein RhuM/Fic/DOC family protein n=1 Tax=Flavicella sediminum TaxID=2585141 RepID=UPI001124B637|nr:virulence protein RhuM/Fic/DOC family protein [Flavicella sediminum]